MNKSLIAVVLAGLAIGFLWPQDEVAGSDEAAAVSGEEAEPKEILLEKENDGHFYADVKINGRSLRMLVDTGATSVAISPEHAEQLGIEFDRAGFEPVARTANGVARGAEVTFDSVSVAGKKVAGVDGMIVEGLDMPLLGQAYLGRLGSIEMAGDYMRIE